MAKPSGKPKLTAALRLRCPYCGVTPLRRPGSWFTFAGGCPSCDYNFEREPGYYSGASWMVNFPAIGVTGFALGGFLLYSAGNTDNLMIPIGVGIYMLVFGALFTPHSMAIWLYFEHLLHPIDAEDRYVPKETETP